MDTLKTTTKKDLSQEDTDLITFNGRLPSINQITHLLIAEAMKRANGNPSIAAKMLYISPQAMKDQIVYWRLANGSAE